MALFKKQRLGIDLGSVNTVIAIAERGVALRQPSLVAIDQETGKVKAFGQEAAELVDRTSDRYRIAHPIQGGVIQDLELTQQMLAYFIKQVVKWSFQSPEVVTSVPSNITKVERQAVVDILKEVGITRAMITEAPIAAAIGTKLAIKEPRGRMIVDLGGGVTDIASISYGEVVASQTLAAGGLLMNEAIEAQIRHHYAIQIGDPLAETLKTQLASAAYDPQVDDQELVITGRHVVTHLPSEQVVPARIVSRAIEEQIQSIIRAIQQVFELTPPELIVDISETGIILTGGGALLKRLPERIQQETGILAHVAPQPMEVVAVGASRLFRDLRHRSQAVEQQRR